MLWFQYSCTCISSGRLKLVLQLMVDTLNTLYETLYNVNPRFCDAVKAISCHFYWATLYVPPQLQLLSSFQQFMRADCAKIKSL